MNAKIIILVFLAIFMINCAEGNKKTEATAKNDFSVHCPAGDSLLFEKLQKELSNRDALSITDVAMSFINSPYEDGTLETGPEEKLVVNFHSFDCVTFVETSLALYETLNSNGDFKTYLEKLRKLRYSDGQIDGYGSRLHYFTAWMIKHEKEGGLQILFQDRNGTSNLQQVNFMIENRDKYPKLVSDTMLPAIENMQTTINSYSPQYIPQEKIEDFEDDIRNGDVIAIVTSVNGLDVSHTGFAVRKNGRIHLLHASSKSDKVKVSALPLADYIKNNKFQKGIMVSRLNDLP